MISHRHILHLSMGISGYGLSCPLSTAEYILAAELNSARIGIGVFTTTAY